MHNGESVDRNRKAEREEGMHGRDTQRPGRRRRTESTLHQYENLK